MTKSDSITIPKKEFIKEHKNLLKVLKSGEDKALAKEFQDQLAEYKTYVGGRAGVSKASGFVMRMMAENKAKHSGQYRKPTTLRADSTMKAPGIFEWKKLASPGQGGENERGNPYGSSPFITKHFKGEYVPFSARPYEAETREQRVARYRFTARRLEKLARELAGDLPEALPALPRPPPPPPRDDAPPPPSRPPSPPPAPRPTIRLTETLDGEAERATHYTPDEEGRRKADEEFRRRRAERADRDAVETVEDEPVRRSGLPEKWDVAFEVDTDDYDNREDFIAEFLAKKPRATLQEIQAHLKKELANHTRDEPEYPKFGTALSSIHEPVKRVREDMVKAYEHTKMMNARFEDILAKPGVSDKLKKLQEFLRRKGTQKGQEKARQTAWNRSRIRQDWQDLIIDAIAEPFRADMKADEKVLFDEFKKYAPALYSQFLKRKDAWSEYKANTLLAREWASYRRIRLNEKYDPILSEVAKRFPSLDITSYDLEKRVLPTSDFEELGVKESALIQGWREITDEQRREASDKLESGREDDETYENPLMKRSAPPPPAEEEEEEEEQRTSTGRVRRTSVAPPPLEAPSAPAEEERPKNIAKREWRLIQLTKETPNISLFDLGKKLKAEGFDGVSASNLSIIINKQLKPMGVWKIEEWSKAFLEARKKTGKGLVEEKRVINSKTPYTLANLPKATLKAYQSNPDVPPSMKDKLGQALELQGGRIKPLEITQEDLLGD